MEDADDVDPPGYRPLDEFLHQVVGKVTVGHQVLAAQEHLELGSLEFLPDAVQAVPGVLVEVTHADVEGGPAPDLHGMVTYLVDALGDG
jgi:hypothetical protein